MIESERERLIDQVRQVLICVPELDHELAQQPRDRERA